MEYIRITETEARDTEGYVFADREEGSTIAEWVDRVQAAGKRRKLSSELIIAPRKMHRLIRATGYGKELRVRMPGAGRPKVRTADVRLSTQVSQATHDWLTAEAKRKACRIGDLIEAYVHEKQGVIPLA